MAINNRELTEFLKSNGYALYFEREPLSIIGDMARINRIDDSRVAQDVVDFNNRPTPGQDQLPEPVIPVHNEQTE